MFKCDHCGRDTPNEERVANLRIHICDECQKKIDREYDFQAEGETYEEYDVICPWCEHHFDSVEAYDNFDVLDGGDNLTCPYCGKHFNLEVNNQPRYSTQRSLCDMPDDWEADDDG